MITVITESKTLTKHENVNVMLENVIQIKSRITINVDESVNIQTNIFDVEKTLYFESFYE